MDPFIEPLAELDVLDAAAGRLAVLAERMETARLAEHAAMVIGHTAHPALTDLPIGFWTSAWLLDIIGGRRSRPAARLLIGVGIATALPTIATGLGDVPQLRSGKRRVVVVHAVCNTAALGYYMASWLHRGPSRDHGRAVRLGWAGAVTATMGGALGGYLSLTPEPTPR